MENKFSQYCYLPLDLPRAPTFDGMKLLEIHKTIAPPVDPPRIDSWSWMQLRWSGENRDDFQALYKYDLNWRWCRYRESTATILEPLIEFIEREIPYRRLTYAVLLSGNTQGVVPHIDFLPLPPEVKRAQPANYRIMIQGDLYPSFFLAKDVEGKNLTYARIPEDTNCFVIHANAYHGAIYRGPKCVLFLNGEIDESRHHKLLERSLEKYRDYGVTFSDLEKSKLSFVGENCSVDESEFRSRQELYRRLESPASK